MCRRQCSELHTPHVHILCFLRIMLHALFMLSILTWIFLYTLCLYSLFTLVYSAYSLGYFCAYSLQILCTLPQVLLEWCDADSEGGGQREWADLTNSDKFPTVYLEKDLLWARRLVPSEQRAVAWPATVSGASTRKRLKWGIPHLSHPLKRMHFLSR